MPVIPPHRGFHHGRMQLLSNQLLSTQVSIGQTCPWHALDTEQSASKSWKWLLPLSLRFSYGNIWRSLRFSYVGPISPLARRSTRPVDVRCMCARGIREFLSFPLVLVDHREYSDIHHFTTSFLHVCQSNPFIYYFFCSPSRLRLQCLPSTPCFALCFLRS